MFRIGQYIVYNSVDVCLVEDIGPLKFIHNCDVDYYTLRPFQINNNTMIYIPVDTTVFMRKIIGRNEARRCLDELKQIRVRPPGTTKQSQLTEHYRELLATHDIHEHLKLFKELHQKDAALTKCGKKLGVVDSGYYKRVSKLLSEELALALRETPEQTLKRLCSAVSKTDFAA